MSTGDEAVSNHREARMTADITDSDDDKTSLSTTSSSGEAKDGIGRSKVYYYEHPFGDYIRWLLQKDDHDDRDDDVVISSTICPCPECRPPTRMRRAWDFFARNVLMIKESSSSSSSSLLVPAVCVNASKYFDRFGNDTGRVTCLDFWY